LTKAFFLNYNLPKHKIAQHPAGLTTSRDESRLLVARLLGDGKVLISDNTFLELPDILNKGDLLVLNDTQVIPCRFFAILEKTGLGVEVLLTKRLDHENKGISKNFQYWEALTKPQKKLTSGDVLRLSESLFAVVHKQEEFVKLELHSEHSKESISDLINKHGHMPIPPYIRKGRSDEKDVDLYQTIFAKSLGSIAAPTAGLHFTTTLLSRLKEKEIETVFITLHVGLPSFIPLREDSLLNDKLGKERYIISAKAKQSILAAKNENRRVIAVGTTCVRAIESWYLKEDESQCIKDTERDTDLFIKPGFSFSLIDAMITNFHQPQSSHLLLVQAFIGIRQIETIYLHALNSDYRFLSYGDAMFIDKEK
jgi:S-adenosylmethionine:tRNA ribosyltransferase-isomerase